VLSNDELKDLKAEELTEIIKNITTMDHRILYYGPRESDELTKTLNNDHHILPERSMPLPEKVNFRKNRPKNLMSTGQIMIWSRQNLS
jgi:zinc protease